MAILIRAPQTVWLPLLFCSRWFTHFYVWGSFWILSITLVYSCSCVPVPFLQYKQIPVLGDVVRFHIGEFLNLKCYLVPTQQQHMDTAVVLSMLSLQVTRRLYESLFVSVFSSSARMHLLHYTLGLFFYPAVALTALIHLDTVDRLEGTVEPPNKGQPFTSE